MSHVKKEKDLKMDVGGVSTLFYNMGIKNLKDKEVFDIVEKQLYTMKDDFGPRLSFGAFYGSLRCDASNYCVNFC